MLKEILNSAGLSPESSAGLLGVSPRIFNEWLAGQRPLPDSMVIRLSTILGIQPELLRVSKKLKGSDADITPAIWYKLRGNRLVDADREFVLLIRQLGFFIHQLEEVTKNKAVGWKVLFESIREATDGQAPPRQQGRQAARMFRESTGLGKGCTGIGEVIRGHLRSLGILVIESPVPESSVEGCSFYIGSGSLDRPTIFANTYSNTWFRRNTVIMHELGHAIFDAQSAGASIDFGDETKTNDLAEERAEAFSQESLIPREVLRHLAQKHGIRWDAMQPDDLSKLVAETHIEQRVILVAAVMYDLLSEEMAASYLQMNIGSELREQTDHALSAEEYLKKYGADNAAWVGKRNTTIPSRTLRLPVHYVNSVLEAFRAGIISQGKAAELLMIDEATFEDRFGEMALALEEF